MTPISITTQYWPCLQDRGPIDCALPRNTGIFHNTTPNKLFLLKEISCIPHTRYLVAATNDVAASHSSFRRNNRYTHDGVRILALGARIPGVSSSNNVKQRIVLYMIFFRMSTVTFGIIWKMLCCKPNYHQSHQHKERRKNYQCSIHLRSPSSHPIIQYRTFLE